MSKRSRDAAFGTYSNRSTKRRTTGSYSGTMTQPVRTFKRSRVPPASRGYRLNKQERKVYDTMSADVNVTTWDADENGTAINIFRPVNGSDYNQRIGRKTVIKSIQVRLACINEAAIAEPPTQFGNGGGVARFILLWDTQPNGALPAVSDVLSSVGGISNVYSPINLNNRDRFKIIRDKMLPFDPFLYNNVAGQSFASASNQVKTFKMYKECNLETIYSASTGAIGDIQSGSLCALFIGSLTGAHPYKFFGSFRCRYEDA